MLVNEWGSNEINNAANVVLPLSLSSTNYTFIPVAKAQSSWGVTRVDVAYGYNFSTTYVQVVVRNILNSGITYSNSVLLEWKLKA